MIRALFLTILYACPEATAVTLPGTVGLPEVLTEIEWKEDFKNELQMGKRGEKSMITVIGDLSLEISVHLLLDYIAI